MRFSEEFFTPSHTLIGLLLPQGPHQEVTHSISCLCGPHCPVLFRLREHQEDILAPDGHAGGPSEREKQLAQLEGREPYRTHYLLTRSLDPGTIEANEHEPRAPEDQRGLHPDIIARVDKYVEDVDDHTYLSAAAAYKILKRENDRAIAGDQPVPYPTIRFDNFELGLLPEEIKKRENKRELKVIKAIQRYLAKVKKRREIGAEAVQANEPPNNLRLFWERATKPLSYEVPPNEYLTNLLGLEANVARAPPDAEYLRGGEWPFPLEDFEQWGKDHPELIDVIWDFGASTNLLREDGAGADQFFVLKTTWRLVFHVPSYEIDGKIVNLGLMANCDGTFDISLLKLPKALSSGFVDPNHRYHPVALSINDGEKTENVEKTWDIIFALNPSLLPQTSFFGGDSGDALTQGFARAFLKHRLRLYNELTAAKTQRLLENPNAENGGNDERYAHFSTAYVKPTEANIWSKLLTRVMCRQHIRERLNKKVPILSSQTAISAARRSERSEFVGDFELLWSSPTWKVFEEGYRLLRVKWSEKWLEPGPLSADIKALREHQKEFITEYEATYAPGQNPSRFLANHYVGATNLAPLSIETQGIEKSHDTLKSTSDANKRSVWGRKTLLQALNDLHKFLSAQSARRDRTHSRFFLDRMFFATRPCTTAPMGSPHRLSYNEFWTKNVKSCYEAIGRETSESDWMGYKRFHRVSDLDPAELRRFKLEHLKNLRIYVVDMHENEYLAQNSDKRLNQSRANEILTAYLKGDYSPDFSMFNNYLRFYAIVFLSQVPSVEGGGNTWAYTSTSLRQYNPLDGVHHLCQFGIALVARLWKDIVPREYQNIVLGTQYAEGAGGIFGGAKDQSVNQKKKANRRWQRGKVGNEQTQGSLVWTTDAVSPTTKRRYGSSSPKRGAGGISAKQASPRTRGTQEVGAGGAAEDGGCATKLRRTSVRRASQDTTRCCACEALMPETLDKWGKPKCVICGGPTHQEQCWISLGTGGGVVCKGCWDKAGCFDVNAPNLEGIVREAKSEMIASDDWL